MFGHFSGSFIGGWVAFEPDAGVAVLQPAAVLSSA